MATAQEAYDLAAGEALADFQADRIGFNEWNRRQRDAVLAFQDARMKETQTATAGTE